MTKIDVLGFAAGTLTTLAFIPQVVKTWKTGSAEDFSLLWLSFFTIGVGMWLAYGLLLGSMPIYIANGVTLLLLSAILLVKLKK